MKDYYIQPLAFRLGSSVMPFTFQNVRVPEEWRQEVLQLQAGLKRRDKEKTSVPADNLNRTLRAILPNLIAIGKKAWYSGEPYWLLSEQILPLSVLKIITREWISESYPKLSQSQLDQIIRLLRDIPLKSEPEELDLASWSQQNGTATYSGHRAIYSLLPHFIAAQFCGDVAPHFAWGDFNKRFFRVPVGYRANGAEVMSWPPEKYDNGERGTDFFSVTLTFTLQTIPFDPRPVLHCDVGLRRWVSRPLKYLEGSASVYLKAPVPWVEGDLSDGFTIAPIHRYRLDSPSSGEAEWKSSWGKKNVLMNVLRHIHLGHPFPTADDLFDNPLAYLEPKGGVTAAMTWASDLNYPDRSMQHSVGTGLPPLDRLKLWEWICDVVSPYLTPVPTLPTIHLQQLKFRPAMSNPFFPATALRKQVADLADADDDEEFEVSVSSGPAGTPDQATHLSVARDNQHQRCELLRAAVGNEVEISLHYDSSDVKIGIEEALSDLFGVRPQSPQYMLPNDVTVHWNPIHKNGPLYSSLFVGNNPGTTLKAGQAREAVEQRRDAIKDILLLATLPAVSIVELLGREKFSPRYTDPKTAIRKGFAHSGRLTQFITPPPSGLPENWQDDTVDPASREERERKAITAFRKRTTNATLDALRQLGVQMPITCRAVNAPLNEDTSLPVIHYVGYWLAKHTSGGSRTGIGGNLPVFIRVDGTTGEVSARAMSVSGTTMTTSWIPYRELLLRLGRDEYKVMNARNHRPLFLEYTKNTVEQLLFGEDYMVFADAQNCRLDGWQYLANTQLQKNKIGYFTGLSPEVITNLPGLRLIRIRDYTQSETPESLVFEHTHEEVKQLTFGAGKGIHRLGEATFYLRTKRPDTMRVSPFDSKLTAFTDKKGKRMSRQPQRSTPHPRLLEVACVGMQPGDNPLGWAALTLKLCEATTHFDGETALPLPLHLAEQVEEYLHPLPTSENEDEEEDE